MSRACAASRVAVALLAAVSCGKGAGSNAAAALAGGEVPAAEEATLEPMDAPEADAWARAKDGDDDDRMRLADRVGCTGLRMRADDPQRQLTAIRAMAFCDDFSELSWLVGMGATAGDPAGLDALETIAALAARRRRATDPEDAEELGAGCRALLALSHATAVPRARRVVAVRALRMLADSRCTKSSDIPTELDAK